MNKNILVFQVHFQNPPRIIDDITKRKVMKLKNTQILNIYEQQLNNIDIKDKKSDKTEDKEVNYDIEGTMLHDKEITLLDSKKDKNADNEEIFTNDIEVLQMGKQSAQIDKEHIHMINDERYQICDYIDTYKDDK